MSASQVFAGAPTLALGPGEAAMASNPQTIASSTGPIPADVDSRGSDT